MNLIQSALLAQQHPALPVISMEEELLELGNASEAAAGMEIDLAEVDRANDLVASLEDLEYVMNSIKGEPTPREASLIQIIGDVAMAGTGEDGSSITPAMEDDGKSMNIADKIKKIIAAIMENLRAVMKKLGEFIRSYTSMAGNTQRRYASVGERLKSAQESGSTENIRMNWAKPGELARHLDQAERLIVDFISGNQAVLRQFASVIQAFADRAPVEVTRKQVNLLASINPGTMYKHKDEDQNGTAMYYTDIVAGRFVFECTLISDVSAIYRQNDEVGPDQILPKIRRVGYNISHDTESKPVDEVQLPKVSELKAIYNSLSGIVAQLTSVNDKNKLLGAAEVRRDFQERFTQQVMGKLSGDDAESTLLAMGVKSAITAMTATSTVPYTRIIQECSYIVNSTLAAINRALDAHEAALKKAGSK